MPEHEGFIASLTEDGKAEVIISPMRQGIPGASPELNKKVCHCATDSSTVVTQAWNRAGASVGDLVVVVQKSAVLFKNAAILCGTPLAGAVAGLVIGVILAGGFSGDVTSILIFVVVGLVAGAVVGTQFYRRFSESSLPVIARVLVRRRDFVGQLTALQSNSRNGQGGCGDCTQCLP